MTKSDFISLLNNPSNTTETKINSLKELTKSFPYCQSAYILLAKSSHDSDSMHANQMLKKAAAYSSHRDILKQIVNKKVKVEKPKAVDKKIETKKEEVKTIKEKKFEKVSKKASSSNILEELKKTLSESKEAKKGFQKIEKIETKKVEKTPPKEKSKTVKKKEVAELPKPKKVEKIEVKFELYPIGYHVFSSRLGNEIQTENEFTSEYPFPISVYNYTIDVPEVISQNDIVDEFIQKTPSIKRAKKVPADEKMENLAAKSIRKKKSPATETLAKLYASQGNKKKAKKIYEELMLKNPEKRSYFADLIKILEK